jgi:hypothetical protein
LAFWLKYGILWGLQKAVWKNIDQSIYNFMRPSWGKWISETYGVDGEISLWKYGLEKGHTRYSNLLWQLPWLIMGLFSWYIFLALFSPYFQVFGYELELLVVSIPMKCNGSDQFGLF